jgi:hypothetical protein
MSIPADSGIQFPVFSLESGRLIFHKAQPIGSGRTIPAGVIAGNASRDEAISAGQASVGGRLLRFARNDKLVARLTRMGAAPALTNPPLAIP